MEPFFIENFWADTFWGIWDIFGRFISTYFGTVSSLSMFSINQPLFLQKTKPIYKVIYPIPSTLNIDLILWHTQLIVCAVKC